MKTTPKHDNFFDLTRHVKIWFQKSPSDRALGTLRNELRIIRHFERNPNHTITLLVDKSLLNDVSQKALDQFVTKQNTLLQKKNCVGKLILLEFEQIVAEITSLDSGEEDEAIADSKVQKLLLTYIRRELDHPYGNPAAASDMARSLTPILDKGIYSDFDLEIPCLQEDVLESNGRSCLLNVVTPVGVYNDFIAAIDSNSKLFREIRKELCDTYSSYYIIPNYSFSLSVYYTLLDQLNLREKYNAWEFLFCVLKLDQEIPEEIDAAFLFKKYMTEHPDLYDTKTQKLLIAYFCVIFKTGMCLNNVFQKKFGDNFFKNLEEYSLNQTPFANFSDRTLCPADNLWIPDAATVELKKTDRLEHAVKTLQKKFREAKQKKSALIPPSEHREVFFKKVGSQEEHKTTVAPVNTI